VASQETRYLSDTSYVQTKHDMHKIKKTPVFLFTGSRSYQCSFSSFVFVLFQDRVSLCGPGCLRTHSVDQAGLELLRDLLHAGVKGMHMSHSSATSVKLYVNCLC
jgi:hypothetical protein